MSVGRIHANSASRYNPGVADGSPYYEHHARAQDPRLRPAREVRDETLRQEVGRVWAENDAVYGLRRCGSSCSASRCRSRGAPSSDSCATSG